MDDSVVKKISSTESKQNWWQRGESDADRWCPEQRGYTIQSKLDTTPAATWAHLHGDWQSERRCTLAVPAGEMADHYSTQVRISEKYFRLYHLKKWHSKEWTMPPFSCTNRNKVGQFSKQEFIKINYTLKSIQYILFAGDKPISIYFITFMMPWKLQTVWNATT